MAREDPQLKLRLTEEMKDRVTRAAQDNGRSVNAEIVSRLESSFQSRLDGKEIMVALYGLAVFSRKSGIETLDELIEEFQKKGLG